METQTVIYLLKFVFCSLFVFMALFIAGWFIAEWMKARIRNEDEYEKLYRCISEQIAFYKVTPGNYDKLYSDLKRLGQMKYKNREKTSVLMARFFWKYREECARRIQETIKK